MKNRMDEIEARYDELQRRLTRLERDRDSEGACAATPQVEHRGTVGAEIPPPDAGSSAPSTPAAKPADAVVVTDAMVERALRAYYPGDTSRDAQVDSANGRFMRAALSAALGGSDAS